MLVKGGRPLQGYSVGIMKFEGKRYPLPPGDVANPTSYPFPVLVREIPHVRTNPSPPLTRADGSYTKIVGDCIDAARQLEMDGVHSLAMCCGFFSLVQPVIAAAVRIPVLTSPLIMLPVIHRMLPPEAHVVVVTASKKFLTAEYFAAVGADIDDRIVVAGLDDAPAFNSICMGGTAITLETDQLLDEVVAAVAKARAENPMEAAVLLECTSLPPFAAELQVDTGLPVFDFVACIEWMHRAIIPKRYEGYL